MKLSKRIAMLAGASALATGLLAPVVQAADPPRQPAPTPVTRPAAQPTSNPRFERLQLACRKVDRHIVHCEWRKPSGSNAVKVVLYGSVNNRGRIALQTLRPPAAGNYDRRIPRGARQMEFVLVTFNSAGKVVGRSAVITIEV